MLRGGEMVLRLVIALAVLWTPTLVRADDSVENAYLLCAMIDGSGLASEPCEISGWGSSVKMTIDMSSSEARKLCVSLAKALPEKKMRFRRGWKLEIYSPYSNGKSIAYCNL